MKLFLPLLILPLLLYWSCEEENDDSEISFTFSDEFVKHRVIGRTTTYHQDNVIWEDDYEWDGLNSISFRTENGGERDTLVYLTYNEYGYVLLQRSPLNSAWNAGGSYCITERFDGWKELSTSCFYGPEEAVIYGTDTMFTWTWEWDGLTSTGTFGTNAYNQYGRLVGYYDETIGEWVYHTLSEDGRRMLIYRGVAMCNGERFIVEEAIWNWEGNEVEVLNQVDFDENCNVIGYSSKSHRVFDEYYNEISYVYYANYSDGNWETLSTRTAEYDYDSPFTPLTP